MNFTEILRARALIPIRVLIPTQEHPKLMADCFGVHLLITFIKSSIIFLNFTHASPPFFFSSCMLLKMSQNYKQNYVMFILMVLLNILKRFCLRKAKKLRDPER